jgi:PKD repeat protein
MNRTAGKSPLAVSFTDLSAGDPLSFFWHFGDGFTSTDRNPVHVYQVPGMYTVTLRAKNNQSTGSAIWNNAINVTGEHG